jgi:hypothetical protein
MSYVCHGGAYYILRVMGNSKDNDPRRDLEPILVILHAHRHALLWEKASTSEVDIL